MESEIHREGKEETKDLRITAKERRGSRPLRLRAIPHIGRLPDQTAPPQTLMKPAVKVDLNSLPPKVKAAADAFAKKFPEGLVDLFVVNVNADGFKESLSTERINLDYVLHPYSIHNYNPEQDNAVEVYVSLYRLNEADPIYSIAGGIEIDAENLFDKSCLRTIGIRKNTEGVLQMSKEGVGFTVSCHYPIVSFFGLSIHILKSKPTLLISL
eukprot:TRINITY_DN5345_c0_g1_i6.p1 TRINITY_DN5345_c0_g1~~TRINITY_DN5345_c0_g1_i6.p1  ORF type:complete len:212 (-),score=39.47 TRINITY_DN5345_c0_g1_i6:317-952(-)